MQRTLRKIIIGTAAAMLALSAAPAMAGVHVSFHQHGGDHWREHGGGRWGDDRDDHWRPSRGHHYSHYSHRPDYGHYARHHVRHHVTYWPPVRYYQDPPHHAYPVHVHGPQCHH